MWYAFSCLALSHVTHKVRFQKINFQTLTDEEGSYGRETVRHKQTTVSSTVVSVVRNSISFETDRSSFSQGDIEFCAF
jgi:hypothetical protein